MKILGIIPARYHSTRFPGKPLINIFGKSMIQRVYEQAKKSKVINELVVATEDERIIREVENFGGNVIMTSKSHNSGTERICEVIKKFDSDIIVNIQGDEPFIKPSNIDKAIFPFLKNENILISTLAVKFNNTKDIYNPNNVKVTFDKNMNALYFSRSVIPFNRYNLENINYFKHIGLYVYRKNVLTNFNKLKVSYLEKTEGLEQLKFLENGINIRIIVVKEDSISVDTKSDYIKIKRKKLLNK